jgi:hypothetical protein
MKNAPPVSPLCAFDYPAFQEVANGAPERIRPTQSAKPFLGSVAAAK